MSQRPQTRVLTFITHATNGAKGIAASLRTEHGRYERSTSLTAINKLSDRHAQPALTCLDLPQGRWADQGRHCRSAK